MNTKQKTNHSHCECNEAIWSENSRHSELVSESTRHCERSEAISSRLPRATALAMTNETGRSMVEMLGILAVIGVLSITGISGYTTAMNKHRANEILDAASKRAVAVSTQLQSGRTNPTLAEFGEDNTVAGATFSTEYIKQGSDKFVIGFTEVPSDEILNQMKNISGTSGIVRAYTADGSLIYNNDLSTDESSSDFDGDSTNCDTTKYTYCSATGTCISGANQSASCPENCAAAYTGSKTKTEAGTDAKQIGNTSCYCTASANWNGTECKSTGKTFKIVSGGYTHSQALNNACETGWHLASAIDDLGCSYGTNCREKLSGLTYEKGTTKWQYDSYYLWISECYGMNGQPGSCPSDDSGEAWYLTGDGDVSFIPREANNLYALCVR